MLIDVGGGPAGVMLGSAGKGQPKLVATRVQTLDDVAPPDYGPDAQSPLFDRPQTYDDLSMGFGLKQQQLAHDLRYRYAINADLSQGRKWMKGPLITTATPATVDSTHGVTDFFEIGGALYYLDGRYVQKRNTDSNFGVSKDLDAAVAGKAGLTARRFKSSGTGTDLVFVSMGSATSDKDWYFDGTTWTQMASFQSLDFLSVGRDFYRASDTNLVSKCSLNADPTVEANWTAANQFRVGDKSSLIVRFGISASGVLLIFKTDGMYSLDDTGQDVKFYPFMTFNPNPNGDSAKQIGYLADELFVQYNGGLFKVDGSFNLTQVGPELIGGNDSPVRGYVTAFMGHQAIGAYAGLYNPDTQTSYLLKYGSWRNFRLSLSGNPLPTPTPDELPAWHGSISAAYASKKITALWLSGIGAPANHERMWIGFSDGSYGYFILPCSPDPSVCGQYQFSVANGQVFLPLFTASFVSERHALRRVTVTGLNFDASNYVDFQYKPDATAAAYTDLGNNFTTSPRQVIDFPKGVFGSISDFQVVLVGAPQPTGATIHYVVRPDLMLEYAFRVLAENGLLDRSGRFIRAGADEVRALVKNAATAVASTTVVLPDESSQELVFRDYGETLAWEERLHSWVAALDVKAVQFLFNNEFGTWGRVGAYTWGQVGAYTWQQITNL